MGERVDLGLVRAKKWYLTQKKVICGRDFLWQAQKKLYLCNVILKS